VFKRLDDLALPLLSVSPLLGEQLQGHTGLNGQVARMARVALR
jgi:hypothetical protein